MTPDEKYQMSETMQGTTLAIAVAVLVVILLGLVSVWRAWRQDWEIEDMTDHYFLDRDSHTEGLVGERWN